jgi:D-serine deaminase-like pyridoxal phosphate-dependent protein
LCIPCFNNNNNNTTTIMASTLADLPTPRFIVHLPTLQRNARVVLNHAERHGIRVRPHIKTHKCIEAACYQLWAEQVDCKQEIRRRTAPSTCGSTIANGITVSTLGEARFFADAGFQDILLAIPVARRKLHYYDALRGEIEKFVVLVDSDASVDAIVAYATRYPDKPWHVVVEIDCGYHRCGIEANGISCCIRTSLETPIIHVLSWLQ